MDRRRSLARKLLVDDRATDRVEMRPFHSRGQAEGAHLANDVTEHRIGIREVGDRASRATRNGRRNGQRENGGNGRTGKGATEKRVPIASFGTRHITSASDRHARNKTMKLGSDPV